MLIQSFDKLEVLFLGTKKPLRARGWRYRALKSWRRKCFSQKSPRLWECVQRPQQWLELSGFEEKRVDLGQEYEEISF